jgi:hypothetical protein
MIKEMALTREKSHLYLEIKAVLEPKDVAMHSCGMHASVVQQIRLEVISGKRAAGLIARNSCFLK